MLQRVARASGILQDLPGSQDISRVSCHQLSCAPSTSNFELCFCNLTVTESDSNLRCLGPVLESVQLSLKLTIITFKSFKHDPFFDSHASRLQRSFLQVAHRPWSLVTAVEFGVHKLIWVAKRRKVKRNSAYDLWPSTPTSLKMASLGENTQLTHQGWHRPDLAAIPAIRLKSGFFAHNGSEHVVSIQWQQDLKSTLRYIISASSGKTRNGAHFRHFHMIIHPYLISAASHVC